MRDHHDAGLTVWILGGWLAAAAAVVVFPIALVVARRIVR